MFRSLGATLILAGLTTPIAAQELAGTWIGDAPHVGGKAPYKVELTVAKEGGDWSIKGILYKDGKEVTKFTGENVKPVKGKVKTAKVTALEFTEEFEMTPAEWSAKPTKVTLKAHPNQVQYDRDFGKKKTLAHLHPKTPEAFARVVLGIVEPKSNKNSATGAAIPSDDPDVLKTGGGVHEMLFTADGKTLITAAGDSVIRFFDMASRKQRASIVCDLGLGTMAITPDGSLLAGNLGHAPVVWDAAGKEIARFPEHRYGVASVALTPDGKTLISTDHGTNTSGHPDGNTKIWDIAGGKELVDIPEDGRSAMVYVPDSQRVVLIHGRYIKNPANPLNSYVNYYRVYDMKGKLQYEKATNHQIVRHMAVSPDQKRVLSACLIGNINLLDVATGKIILTIKCRPFTYINTCAFTPDGQRFAVGGSGGQVAIFETATGKELAVLKAYPAEIRRIAFSPDGQWLAATGYGTDVRLVGVK
jgi:WD40 repeat protein